MATHPLLQRPQDGVATHIEALRVVQYVKQTAMPLYKDQIQ